MITDRETNVTFYSKLLQKKYPESFERINRIMKRHDCDFFYLRRTNDIWARDYMPIQVDDYTYVEFRYDPDYLLSTKEGYRDTKTYPDMVCKAMGFRTKKSNILLDGGNVIKSKDCIILTDKILIENKFKYNQVDLLEELEHRLLVKKIILIPWDQEDEFGHADGMVRFIDNETVLVNHFYKDDKNTLDPFVSFPLFRAIQN
jgi:agmatine deiminase